MYFTVEMANGGVAKAVGVVSVIHLVLGILSIIIGVLQAQICPYPYDGLFYMGAWMGVWVSRYYVCFDTRT